MWGIATFGIVRLIIIGPRPGEGRLDTARWYGVEGRAGGYITGDFHTNRIELLMRF